jgi:hypothetical protein
LFLTVPKAGFPTTMFDLDRKNYRPAVCIADEGAHESGLAANARFEVRSKIGSGGFGEVYEALDRDRRTVVALKYLRQFEPEQLYRLKREFRIYSDYFAAHSEFVECVAE